MPRQAAPSFPAQLAQASMGAAPKKWFIYYLKLVEGKEIPNTDHTAQLKYPVVSRARLPGTKDSCGTLLPDSQVIYNVHRHCLGEDKDVIPQTFPSVDHFDSVFVFVQSTTESRTKVNDHGFRWISLEVSGPYEVAEVS